MLKPTGWFPSDAYCDRIEPAPQVGVAEVRIDGVKYGFVFDDREPGSYIIRFRPGRLDWANLGTLTDRELAMTVDPERGIVRIDWEG